MTCTICESTKCSNSNSKMQQRYVPSIIWVSSLIFVYLTFCTSLAVLDSDSDWGLFYCYFFFFFVNTFESINSIKQSNTIHVLKFNVNIVVWVCKNRNLLGTNYYTVHNINKNLFSSLRLDVWSMNIEYKLIYTIYIYLFLWYKLLYNIMLYFIMLHV